jgi:mono/diheme cytochrome c family protein
MAIALGIVGGGRALAADAIDEALSNAGKVWYDKYCTPCHGPGGTPGEAVFSATKKPIDLRTYVERHGGKFPAANWLAIVSGTRPGNVHSRIWEDIKSAQASSVGNEVAARGTVGAIARYVMSIQEKKK